MNYVLISSSFFPLDLNFQSAGEFDARSQITFLTKLFISISNVINLAIALFSDISL